MSEATNTVNTEVPIPLMCRGANAMTSTEIQQTSTFVSLLATEAKRYEDLAAMALVDPEGARHLLLGMTEPMLGAIRMAMLSYVDAQLRTTTAMGRYALGAAREIERERAFHREPGRWIPGATVFVPLGKTRESSRFLDLPDGTTAPWEYGPFGVTDETVEEVKGAMRRFGFLGGRGYVVGPDLLCELPNDVLYVEVA